MHAQLSFAPLLAAFAFLAGPVHGQKVRPQRLEAPGGVFGLYGVPLTGGTQAAGPCTLLLPPSDAALDTTIWPGGNVPYQFEPNVSAGEAAAMLDAMDILESIANVDFFPRTSQAAFLRIQDDTGNFSTSVGYTGAMVTIGIASWGSQGVLLHELMHALGFYHEQSRPDRNSFVTIVVANIQTPFLSNFGLVSSAFTAGPYDFVSLMHYDGCAFSICCSAGSTCNCPSGCETILAPGHQDEIGQRSSVSALDAHGLRSLYPFSNWRFVDRAHSTAGSGTGTNPWRELSSAVNSAPTGSTVFVMPGTYDLASTWSRSLVIAAPVEGVRVN